MSEQLKLTGTITKVLEVEGGTSKAGKEWQKQCFILDTKTKYNNIYCFEIFGEDLVNEFNHFNKEGDDVEVSFNVSTNEWKGKYFTTLSAWKVFKAIDETNRRKGIQEVLEADESEDDLPF